MKFPVTAGEPAARAAVNWTENGPEVKLPVALIAGVLPAPTAGAAAARPPASAATAVAAIASRPLIRFISDSSCPSRFGRRQAPRPPTEI